MDDTSTLRASFASARTALQRLPATELATGGTHVEYNPRDGAAAFDDVK
jgi:hypothetical protein